MVSLASFFFLNIPLTDPLLITALKTSLNRDKKLRNIFLERLRNSILQLPIHANSRSHTHRHTAATWNEFLRDNVVKNSAEIPVYYAPQIALDKQ